jgi:hypothetical protein
MDLQLICLGANPRLEPAMKLTSAQIERTLSQFEAQAIPESHPVLTRLNELFGDHTFFVDSDGLSIVTACSAENSSRKSRECCELER